MGSDLVPFLFVTVLGAAIRYGLFESAAAAAYNSLIVFVLRTAADPPATIGAAATLAALIFLIGLLAGLLSREQKRYHRLALEEGKRSTRLLRERQDLLRRLMTAQEEERKRVVGELHDRLGRMIFEVLFGIRRLQALLSPGQAGLREELQAADSRVAACADGLRNFMERLRPAVLDDFGFPQAIAEYIESLDPADPKRCAIKLNVRTNDAELAGEAHLMFFRVAQEALVNVLKHSRATAAELFFGREGERVVLRVKDNGVGFDPEKVPRGHYGLLYMRERAEAYGAAWHVGSSPGRGTVVEVRLPVASRGGGAGR